MSTLEPLPSSRELTYAEAVREGLEQAMAADHRVVVIGEGVPDPKGIFGTTSGLRTRFGAHRVLDMPLAENGMTGIAIGAALVGLRPVMTHQRIDFTLLALDALVNTAAKWHYLFHDQTDALGSDQTPRREGGGVPLVVRAIIGRGWGQGPQHSQSLQAIFAHIPGLKVVMPTTAYDAKGMMLAAIADPNPVIFIEHRWLHGNSSAVPAASYIVPLDRAMVRREGSDITLAAFSLMTLEALRAAQVLAEFGLEAEVIDLRAVRPWDVLTVVRSVKKTGRLLVLDTGPTAFGVAAEVVAEVAARAWSALRSPPHRLAMPDHPVPTAPALANRCYPGAREIALEVLALCDRPMEAAAAMARLPPGLPQDVPDPGFKGPF